jgi:hypothetical protein
MKLARAATIVQQLTYHNNPNQAPYSERNSGGCPDGYFVRPSTGVHVNSHGKSEAIGMISLSQQNSRTTRLLLLSFSLMDKS